MPLTADNGAGGYVSKGKATLPSGKEVVTGAHRVNAGGGRRFTSGEWVENQGIDDARDVRAARNGEAPCIPIHIVMDNAQKSAVIRAENDRREKMGLAPKALVVDAPVMAKKAETELVTLLEACDGDYDLQQIVLKKWNAKQAKLKAAAEKAAAPAPAETPAA